MVRSTTELRQVFLDYFAERGHERVPSSSLVPANDSTLLFTNAGMVQFKDAFLGLELRAVPRAVSVQRCVRAGGKHNDLENVGYTGRHLTFFEMLGNFSFGDYFKREAIHYAWDFVTRVLGLPPERLWCTVYKDDREAADIWLKDVGVSAARLSRLGEKDNFWAMGDTGPCGPCSEIFFDHGPEVAGGPPGSPAQDGDRFVEIWNLVFMQYERNEAGELKALPRPSVDTGMGLERLAAVMQRVHSNYEIDLFARLIDDAARITRTADRASSSLRVIADHIRSCSFLIVDGVLPSNEGRGYVLRRIIRRAIRHGYKLGAQTPFFHRLVPSLDSLMGQAYPELGRQRAHVEQVLEQEETRFAETLTQGMRLLEDVLAGVPRGGVVPGDTVFKLYDTYGFPEDLTADVARERGLAIDRAGFDAAMAGQRERARRASRFGAGGAQALTQRELVEALERAGLPPTEFVGYDHMETEAQVLALLTADGHPLETLAPGTAALVVLDSTPFYAEGGGQVGDAGLLEAGSARFTVEDTQRMGAWHVHVGRASAGELGNGARVLARVDPARRQAIRLNHSATHLLHAALRHVLGEHAQQKGSLVAADRLRFDFTHDRPIESAQLARIEQLVNEQIRLNSAADVRQLTYREALAQGAVAFFGDKYGEEVRMLRLGPLSLELCGGTHVARTGDIGLFKIVAESGVAAGVRRIEAVTGQGALEWIGAGEAVLRRVAELVKGGREDLPARVTQLAERVRGLEREAEQLRGRLATSGGRDLAQAAIDVQGVKVLATQVDGADAKSLRATVDQLRDRLGSAVVVLGAVEQDKVRLVAGVTADLTGRVKAGELIRVVAEQVGGRGGGRDDFAQAGGTEPARLPEALAAVASAVAALLGR